MSFSGQMFQDAQEQLFEEKLEELIEDGMDPDAAEEAANEWIDSYDGCDEANDRVGDNLAEKGDQAHQAWKDRRDEDLT